MRKEIEKKLKRSIPKFKKKVDAIRDSSTWYKFENGSFSNKIPKSFKKEHVVGPFTKRKLKGNTVRKQLDDSETVLVNDLINHYEEMDKIIPLCSEPRGFKKAWDLRADGQDITKYELRDIVNLGGQMQLENRDTSERVKMKVSKRRKKKSDGTGESIFSIEGQGQQFFVRGSNGKFFKALRHRPNRLHTYDDFMNEQYVFNYQPTEKNHPLENALRYRWMEELSSILGLGLVVLIVLWFNHDVNDKINRVLFLAPARIIPKKRKDLNKSLFEPLQFELISQNKFEEFKDDLYSMGKDAVADMEPRNRLDKKTERAWSYDMEKSGLVSADLQKSIKEWAKKTGRRCPQCKKKFDTFANMDIEFGHIVSKDWARTFRFLLAVLNNPDNLYLTCRSCNSTLSHRFPDFIKFQKQSGSTETLRDRIEKIGKDMGGTIGDWVRNYEDEIRKM